jgi:hypothetical protein
MSRRFCSRGSVWRNVCRRRISWKTKTETGAGGRDGPDDRANDGEMDAMFGRLTD